MRRTTTPSLIANVAQTSLVIFLRYSREIAHTSKPYTLKEMADSGNEIPHKVLRSTANDSSYISLHTHFHLIEILSMENKSYRANV